MVISTFIVLVPLLEHSLPLGTWTLQNHHAFHDFAMVQEVIAIPLSSIFAGT
ncbi:hypothetical protein ILUMI_11333, partial [Ignelater luminosus]